MPTSKDVKEISGGRVHPARRFDKRDFDYIAEYVEDTWKDRKKNRKDLERQWKEIDRQIAMTPDITFKHVVGEAGERHIDKQKMWMAEMELPLQAQALEVLTADARRLMFPDTGPWFRAHAEMTDEYLKRVDFSSLITGDELEVPSLITQDNADKLTAGFVSHNFRQIDYATRQDKINAESFKYGMGVGRCRMERKNVYIHEAKGTRKESQLIPNLVPVCIKKLYLDDRPPSVHSAQVLGDAHILEDKIKVANLVLAANRGSTDPEDEDGGWMPDALKGIEGDDNGYVTVLEMEGDCVVPRKTVRSVVIPGAIITVVLGKDAKKSVIRFRYRKEAFSSYLLYPYHYESADDPYPTSPLMKGRPIQIAAVDALNRLMDSAALKNAPPVGYDRSDMVFARSGGPVIHPNAIWETIEAVNVHAEIGGEPSQIAAVFTVLVNLYAELTGILPARLGAQTVSHTTAFAKDAELQRGAVRTVDFVRQSGKGPVERWLDMHYRMARKALKGDITIWIEAYGGFVTIDRDALPDVATFEWFGAGGPAEEQAKQQAKLASLQLALQMDQLQMAVAAQSGQPAQQQVDVPAAIREVLREGGWTDIDVITRTESVTGGPAPAPGVSPTDALNSGTVSTALQALAFGNQGS